MTNRIKLCFGFALLMILFISNLRLSISDYGIKNVPLTDFFFEQCGSDKVIDHKNYPDQKCKTSTVGQIILQVTKDNKDVIFQVRKITIDDVW